MVKSSGGTGTYILNFRLPRKNRVLRPVEQEFFFILRKMFLPSVLMTFQRQLGKNWANKNEPNTRVSGARIRSLVKSNLPLDPPFAPQAIKNHAC